jgi:hypothetical protein
MQAPRRLYNRGDSAPQRTEGCHICTLVGRGIGVFYARPEDRWLRTCLEVGAGRVAEIANKKKRPTMKAY